LLNAGYEINKSASRSFTAKNCAQKMVNPITVNLIMVSTLN